MILAWNEVHEEAIRSGNYDAVDCLVDLEDAMENASLSERERDVADLVRRWDIAEVAGIVGVEESSARTFLMRAATKISEYMRGGEEDV